VEMTNPSLWTYRDAVLDYRHATAVDPYSPGNSGTDARLDFDRPPLIQGFRKTT
jgi:hypothetical protein